MERASQATASLILIVHMHSACLLMTIRRLAMRYMHATQL